MFFPQGRSNQQVVDICEDKIQAHQNLVDKPLKRVNGIAKSEWHYEELEQTERRCYRCFRNVSFCHRYLMIRSRQVDGREHRFSV